MKLFSTFVHQRISSNKFKATKLGNQLSPFQGVLFKFLQGDTLEQSETPRVRLLFTRTQDKKSTWQENILFNVIAGHMWFHASNGAHLYTYNKEYMQTWRSYRCSDMTQYLSGHDYSIFSNIAALGVLKLEDMAQLAYRSIITKIIIIQITILSNNFLL